MQRFDCLAAEAIVFGPHFLEASAGTGKTFAIEHIVARLILEGVDIEQILVVTFTRAAARELKLRIRSNLEKIIAGANWAYLPTNVKLIGEALASFDRCQIFTIHGFCSGFIWGSKRRKIPVSIRLCAISSN
jgi:exodeoxyribonuclease V beta subunit